MWVMAALSPSTGGEKRELLKELIASAKLAMLPNLEMQSLFKFIQHIHLVGPFHENVMFRFYIAEVIDIRLLFNFLI